MLEAFRSRARVAARSLLVLLAVALVPLGSAACGSSTTTSTPPAAASTSPAAANQTPASDRALSSAEASPTALSSQALSSAGTGTFDACALLSAVDLTKIVGGDTPSTKAMLSVGWVAGGCAFSSHGSSFVVSVGTADSIRQAGDPTAMDAKAKLALFKASATSTPRDVSGIGDGAVLAPTGIAAYKGGTYVEVMNLTVTNDQLITIAKLLVAKL